MRRSSEVVPYQASVLELYRQMAADRVMRVGTANFGRQSISRYDGTDFGAHKRAIHTSYVGKRCTKGRRCGMVWYELVRTGFHCNCVQSTEYTDTEWQDCKCCGSTNRRTRRIVLCGTASYHHIVPGCVSIERSLHGIERWDEVCTFWLCGLLPSHPILSVPTKSPPLPVQLSVLVPLALVLPLVLPVPICHRLQPLRPDQTYGDRHGVRFVVIDTSLTQL